MTARPFPPDAALTRDEVLAQITALCTRVAQSTVADVPTAGAEEEAAEAEAAGAKPWWPPALGDTPLVRTRRLVGHAVDPDNAAHLAALCAWWNDRAAAPWMDAGSEGTAYTPARLAEGFRADYARADTPGDLYVVFSERAPGARPVGFAALYDRDAARRCAELSYQVGARECRGRGYATEMVRAMCAYAFGRARCASVHVSVVVENAASTRVALRCGFRCYGLRPQSHVGTRAGRPALYDELLLVCFPEDLAAATAAGRGDDVTLF